jgi:hypothetical protein
MHRKFIILAPLLLLMTAAISQNYVTLYEDCNYSGKSKTLEAGTYNLSQMRIDNDVLSSMQIPQGMKVTIYEDDNFRGRSKTFYNNVSCLDKEWNDMASSIVVENQNVRQNYNQNDYVIFYNDCNGKGFSQTLRPGRYKGDELGNLKNNISSFTIYGNLRVKAYINNENLSGYSITHETSEACLANNENDKIGSLVIEYKHMEQTYPTQPTYPTHGNNDYVTIYTDCNYRGNSLRLGPGSYPGDKLGLFKYDISAIEIPSTLKARVYINNEYMSGSSYTLSENIGCMNSTLNNRIGSLVIEENYGNNNNGYNNNNNQYQNNTNERVVIYTDANYKGQSVSLLPGTYSTMAQAGFPDKALSSLTVPPGYRVVLYESENFSGKSITITGSTSGFLFSKWNDRTSSIAVYRDR